MWSDWSSASHLTGCFLTEVSFLYVVVFSGINLPKTLEPQQSWPEFNPVSSSIWDIPSNDSLHSWPSSSSSPTAPTAVRPSTCFFSRCFSCFWYFHKCSLTSFFPNFFSHSWETPAIPGLRQLRSGAPFGQRVQIPP